jgi:prepilin-type N-terminal cleavage/methylation domain-containing protein
MDMKLPKDKGVTLIELMIALVISAIIVAALYRSFVSQQKSYVVQAQVADMQQNARVAINRMMKEIRMAGFGVKDVLNPPGVNGYTVEITPNANSITIVGGFRQISRLAADAKGGEVSITLANATEASQFDGAIHHFICIGGIESHIVQGRAGAVLTLDNPLKVNHPAGAPVFKIHALTYGIRDDNGIPVLFRDLYSNTASTKRETVAENIESLEFEYFDASGNPTVTPADVRMVRVTLTARTDLEDRELKKVRTDGFRRRIISSNIQIRNMGVSP